MPRDSHVRALPPGGRPNVIPPATWEEREKRKTEAEGTRRTGTGHHRAMRKLPLVGLGVFDLLFLAATVLGVYQGHLKDFWADHYTK